MKRLSPIKVFGIVALLYGPFVIIVRDPSSPWWLWLAIPAWPLQIISSNVVFMGIAGTCASFALIGLIASIAQKGPKRFLTMSLLTAAYSISSALFMQWAIHAG